MGRIDRRNGRIGKMMLQGTLLKMKTEQGQPIRYTLYLGENEVLMNEFIGHPFSMRFTGNIYCLNCGKKTSKSFNQGYCYACFLSAPECSECIIRPELCQAHLGLGRDPEWEQLHHNQPHIVYLAATDVVKVGVTRETQIPTRWIDQGCSSSIIFARTPNRFEAGKIEVALKDFFTDKTNWRHMLQNKIDENINLVEEKWRIAEQMPSDIEQFISDDEAIFTFDYPVLSYPEKVNSINLDKNPLIQKKLVGIKAQYLIFDDNSVINIRKYQGYEVEIGK